MRLQLLQCYFVVLLWEDLFELVDLIWVSKIHLRVVLCLKHRADRVDGGHLLLNPLGIDVTLREYLLALCVDPRLRLQWVEARKSIILAWVALPQLLSSRHGLCILFLDELIGLVFQIKVLIECFIVSLGIRARGIDGPHALQLWLAVGEFLWKFRMLVGG